MERFRFVIFSEGVLNVFVISRTKIKTIDETNPYQSMGRGGGGCFGVQLSSLLFDPYGFN
jgi:hypothetical protein